MNDQINVIIRSPEPTDKDFIMATWLNGNRYGSAFYELQKADTYFKEYAKKITQALIHPDTWVRIACADDNIDWIVGFTAFRDNALYWVYVRDGYRNKGIAKLMLKGVNIQKIRGISKIGAAIAYKRGLAFEPL